MVGKPLWYSETVSKRGGMLSNKWIAYYAYSIAATPSIICTHNQRYHYKYLIGKVLYLFFWLYQFVVEYQCTVHRYGLWIWKSMLVTHCTIKCT